MGVWGGTGSEGTVLPRFSVVKEQVLFFSQFVTEQCF